MNSFPNSVWERTALKPRITELLHADSRFKDVRASTYTGVDGAIGLFGRVASEADLLRLLKVLADARLPVTIYWQVEVLADEAEQKVSKS